MPRLRRSKLRDDEVDETDVNRAGGWSRERIVRRFMAAGGGPYIQRLPAPILLRLAPHRLARRVLALEPVGRAAGAVGRGLALRHDALQAHLAGMREHGRAVGLDMLVEPHAGRGLGQDGGQRGLAHLKRFAPQVVAVQLDQVEGVEEHAGVVAAVAQPVEVRHAVVVAAHRLAVEDAGSRAQAGERLDDQREAVGEVVAGAAVQPHAVAVLARDDAEAVVLDLVQPRVAGRRLRRLGRQAWRDEAERQGHGRVLERRCEARQRGLRCLRGFGSPRHVPRRPSRGRLCAS